MFGDDEHQSTIRHARFDPTEAPAASFVVSAGGKQLVIDDSTAGRAFVGSSPACELSVEDRAISRRHLALELRGSELSVEDLGSKNGTFLDGVRIREAFVSDKATLVLGGTIVTITRDRPRDAALPAADSFGRVMGASREMRRIYPICARLAASDVPAIIEGETGTGKEILAECIHEQSARRGGPFVVFDCTAVQPSLVEAELFGHERGAFTGAVAQRKGVFEQAHGGTLFIDEIGDLDPALQPKLLRGIERSEVRRVGGDKWIKVDVRILCATRRDLEAEVEAGRFRDDLFHRLAVGRVELPPLRARRGDVALLVRHFAKQMGFAPDAVPLETIARWERETWPGNVRELRNAVSRFLALGTEEPARTRRLKSGDVLGEIIALKLPFPEAKQRLLDEFERRYVDELLREHGGNVSRAAEAAGVARRYFQLVRARTEK